MDALIRSSVEMENRAMLFTASLLPKDSGARVVTLSGDLGAGKTTFAQGVAKALGVEGVITSPTFVLEKIYQLNGTQFSRLVHIDAYRLKSAREIEALGWKDLVYDAGNLIIIEWPENVAEAIPTDAIRIRFDIIDDGRIITIDGKKN